MLAQKAVLIALVDLKAIDMEQSTDALKLLWHPCVSHVCHLNIVIEILDVIRLKPENTIVEECLGQAFLEGIAHAAEDAVFKVALL